MRNSAGELPWPARALHPSSPALYPGTLVLMDYANWLHDRLASLGFKPWEVQKVEEIEENEVIALDPSSHAPSRYTPPPAPLPGLPHHLYTHPTSCSLFVVVIVF